MLKKTLFIILVLAVFAGSVPLVFAAGGHACDCSHGSCGCKEYICHVTCAGAALVENSAFSPPLALAGLLALPADSLYQHKPIRTVFHPPNVLPVFSR